ncbi:MAG: SMC-Scp complex subunit ScpB [Deltaproteobacteria bacterium]|nr:SMC-Scp complex subunit ScpB [Deltaproteobacteria bacterium]
MNSNEIKETDIEALVLASGEKGIKVNEILEHLNMSYHDFLATVNNLNKRPVSFVLKIVGPKIYAVIREEFQGLLRKAGFNERIRLTQPALETLAVIGYLSPCRKSFIDYLRGVDSTQSINTLLETGLIERVSSEQKAEPVFKLSEKAFSFLGISSEQELDNYQSIRDEFHSKLQNFNN